MYSYLYSYLLILIKFLKYFYTVYQLAVWIEILHMTFSTSHSSGNSVHQVYGPQQNCKIPYS